MTQPNHRSSQEGGGDRQAANQGSSQYSALQEREIAEWKKEMAGATPMNAGGRGGNGGSGRGSMGGDSKVQSNAGHAPKRRVQAAAVDDEDDYADDQFEAEF
jgi:hypothetical protein